MAYIICRVEKKNHFKMKFHLENPPQRTVSFERSKLFRRQSISNLPRTPIISSTSGATPKSCPPVLPACWPSVEFRITMWCFTNHWDGEQYAFRVKKWLKADFYSQLSLFLRSYATMYSRTRCCMQSYIFVQNSATQTTGLEPMVVSTQSRDA